jgi:uncharacterized protein YkwD
LLVPALLLAGCIGTPTGTTRQAANGARPKVARAVPSPAVAGRTAPAPPAVTPPSPAAANAPDVVSPRPTFAPSAAPALRNRHTRDQPDDFKGYQIHVVYALPKGAPDEELDRKGTLARAVEVMNDWLSRNGDGAALRFDTHQNDLDVTFMRLSATDAELQAGTGGAFDGIRAEITEAGFITPGKILAVFYGADGVRDDETHIGKAIPGFGVAFLKSTAHYSLQSAITNTALETVMLHELVHALGMNVSDAKAHVFDKPNDLMATKGSVEREVLLDYKRDNYFAHGLAGDFDLSRSLVLKRPPADARPPNDWPYSLVPAPDGLDPMTGASLPTVDGDQAFENALLQAVNAERTKAGLTALMPTESLQTIARVTASDIARAVATPTPNLGLRAGHWGGFTSLSLTATRPTDASAEAVQGLLEQLLSSSTRRAQLLDAGATELAVGAVRLADRQAITVAIGKATVDVRRLRIGATPHGVYTFSGEVRALRKPDFPLLYVETDGTVMPFPVPLGTGWSTFVSDVPRDGKLHRVTLRQGSYLGSQALPVSWRFDGAKPPAETMVFTSETRPVLAVSGSFQPLPVPPMFE